MAVPKLVSNRHGRAQPATRAQRFFFDDYDPAVDDAPICEGCGELVDECRCAEDERDMEP